MRADLMRSARDELDLEKRTVAKALQNAIARHDLFGVAKCRIAHLNDIVRGIFAQIPLKRCLSRARNAVNEAKIAFGDLVVAYFFIII